LAHYILTVMASKIMHHFPPHLIFTYRTLHLFILTVHDAFSQTVKFVNVSFNKDRILINKFVSAEWIYTA